VKFTESAQDRILESDPDSTLDTEYRELGIFSSFCMPVGYLIKL